jgi:hypothetical protein
MKGRRPFQGWNGEDAAWVGLFLVWVGMFLVIAVLGFDWWLG